MLSLVTADLHLSDNPRDAYRHKILQRLYKQAERLGVGRTFILGDLTEAKDRHSDWLVNAVSEHVRRFAKLGDVIILKGNHDYLSDPDVPFFHFLRHMPQVRWVCNPTGCELPSLGRTLLLPHTRSYKRDWAQLTFKDYAFIFAHSTFLGAQFDAYRKADEGIPLEIFPEEARVISGDVHVPQQLGCVTYVGAPFTIDFGDDYQARFLLLENDQVRSIPLEGPQKRLVTLDGRKNELAQLDALNTGDILKVKVHMPRRNAHLWPEHRDLLREKYEKNGWVVHSIVPVIDEELGTRVKVRARDAKTDEQIMREFARHRSVSPLTLKRGMKLL